MSRKLVGTQQCAYLKFELESDDRKRQKIALQSISKLYRTNHTLSSENRRAFEQSINGLVLQSNQDQKVARWCLNALAHVGAIGSADQYIGLALKQYEGEPEIVSAGIAALSKLYGPRIVEAPAYKNYDPTMRTLAAMQHTEPRHLDLTKIKIDIEKSDKEVLKLALITVGLNREIENLFHPRHTNGQIVKVLGQFPDSVVVQYTVWAIIENRKLALTDLGIRTDRVDLLTPNVQSKLMQLIAEREADKERKNRIIADGPFLSDFEAREGLAKGLSRNYYDGLEEITIDWFNTESSKEIRMLLAEHFARFSDDCYPYEQKAVSILEEEPSFKELLLLGAEGKKLYRKIREGDANFGTSDLFSSQAGQLDDLSIRIRKIESKETKAMTELKVLFLSASPINEGRLRLDQEARDIKEKLRAVEQPNFQVTVSHEWAVRVDQIQDILLNQKPTVLHFSGHGGGGTICFEDQLGKSMPVEAEAFSKLIELNKDCIKCVVLNSCYSVEVAKDVISHVECVIGCDASISDVAAIAFSRAFYRALAHGRDYEGAFRLAKNDVELANLKGEAEKYKLLRS